MQAQRRPQLILRKPWCREALQQSLSGLSVEPGRPLLSHQPWVGTPLEGGTTLTGQFPRGLAAEGRLPAARLTGGGRVSSPGRITLLAMKVQEERNRAFQRDQHHQSSNKMFESEEAKL